MIRINLKIETILIMGVISMNTSTSILAGSSPPKKAPESKEIIHPFNFEGVQLLPGRLNDQFQQVKAFYLALDEDDMLKGFRERAGLPAPGEGIGGAYSNSALTFGQWLLF